MESKKDVALLRFLDENIGEILSDLGLDNEFSIQHQKQGTLFAQYIFSNSFTFNLFLPLFCFFNKFLKIKKKQDTWKKKLVKLNFIKI